MEHKTRKSKPPLIYSCSGCSSAAQLANHLAIKLDREGLAEMSCIAGVGGDVPSLVRVAKSNRPIIAIDGCPLQCAKSCLKRHEVVPTLHFTLSELKIKKTFHQDFSTEDAARVLSEIKSKIEALPITRDDEDPDSESQGS